MFNIIFTISIIIFGFHNNIFTQDYKPKYSNQSLINLTGTVKDSLNLNPIEYASISLYDFKKNEIIMGAITDESGIFTLKNIPNGIFKIEVNYIGYKKYTIPNITISETNSKEIDNDLGTIFLALSAIKFSEINTLGEQPNIINTIDKKIINVDESLIANSGTANDIFINIPSIDIDIDGNIFLRGDKNVTILIDGQFSGLTQINRHGNINNIPASIISQIEIITNPSAKYDPDGAGGIINIILKKDNSFGSNGLVSISAGQYHNYNISGMINFRKNKFNIYSNGSIRYDNILNKGERTYRYFYPNFVLPTISQKINREKKPILGSLELGYDYFFNSQKSISFKTVSTAYQENTTESIYTTGPANFNINSKEYFIGLTTDIHGSYNQKFDNPKNILNTDFYYSLRINNANANYGNSNTNAHPGLGPESDKIKLDNYLSFSIDYNYPINKQLILENGIKTTIKRFYSELDYIHNPYSFNYREYLYAGYISIDYSISDFLTLRLGNRLEKTYTNNYLQEIPHVHDHDDSTNVFTKILDSVVYNSPFERVQLQSYPSLYLNFSFNRLNQIQLGLSKRINRPRIETLNPFPKNTFDKYHIRNGNPFLIPELTDILELSYLGSNNNFSFNSSIYYKHITNMIRWHSHEFLTIGEEQYELITTKNVGDANSHGIELIFKYHPINAINLLFSFNTWNSNNYSSNENHRTSGYISNGILNLKIPKFPIIEFITQYHGPMNIVNGNTKAYFFSSISFQKSFADNRFNIILNISDLFRSNIFKIDMEQTIYNPTSELYYTQHTIAERKKDRQKISLNLNYNFGTSKINKQLKQKQNNRNNFKTDVDMDY